ncbi:MAG: hypothetical protein Q7J15_08055 [Candidatus Desulfaltia sp.]|nr:hypothetical protein [Candidatus Desulfaltia sp.]
MQVIKTKHFGPISFIKTWVSSDGRHIGKLAKGGYAHLSGSPVTAKKDLSDLIPSGQDKQDALEWFDHKDEVPPKMEMKRITLTPDGGYEWEDGSEITDAADIYNTLPKGVQLEAVLNWFTRKQSVEKGKAKMERSAEQKTTDRLKREQQEQIALAHSQKTKAA